MADTQDRVSHENEDIAWMDTEVKKARIGTGRKYTWTVDVETDWGGRGASTQGVRHGLPRILGLFRAYNIRALFFISTELIRDHKLDLDNIVDAGHEIGSHGHFHVEFKDQWRHKHNKEVSEAILKGFYNVESVEFRSPRFHYKQKTHFYNNPENHVSLLKALWLKKKVKEDTILYLHPFDIVEPRYKPPNLFCKLWYSRPLAAWSLLTKMVDYYPGGCRLR